MRDALIHARIGSESGGALYRFEELPTNHSETASRQVWTFSPTLTIPADVSSGSAEVAVLTRDTENGGAGSNPIAAHGVPGTYNGALRRLVWFTTAVTKHCNVRRRGWDVVCTPGSNLL